MARLVVLVIVVLTTAACGGSDASIPASAIETHLAKSLGWGTDGLTVGCLDRGDQDYDCSVTPAGNESLSGTAEVKCRSHDPGPEGNDVTCS